MMDKFLKIVPFLNLATVLYFVFFLTISHLKVQSQVLQFFTELTMVPMLFLCFILGPVSIFLLYKKPNLLLIISYLFLLALHLFMFSEFY
ncbi:hypothetical protein DHD80_10185 [Gramella sp. AN32]|nr:hypothetical protein [Gramella sp. AN32]